MIEALSPFFQGPLREAGAVLFIEPQPPVPLAGFLRDGRLEKALSSFAHRWENAHPQATASQWSKLYFARLLPAVFIPAIFGNWWLPLEPTRMGLRLDADGGVSGFDLPHAGSAAPAGTGERFTLLITESLPPLIDAIAKTSGLPAKVLWNNAGNIAETIISRAEGLLGGDHPGVAEAKALLTDRRHGDGRINPLFEPVRYRQTEEGTSRIRRLCCLRYFTPALGYCKSCPTPPRAPEGDETG